MTQMTVELLKATLPKALAGNATQELADHINNIALDPEVAEEVRSNFLSYTKILQDGKFKTEDYLNAVTYVTHKLMGYSNQDAYIRTFPVRYQSLVAKGMSSKDVSAYVAAYHKNKLVNLILEQSLIPSWLLNLDVYQRAINTQFELMTDVDVSAKVRSDAANSILTHLKQPEVQKVQLEVGVKDGGGIQDLMATMHKLAAQQRELIQAGVPARQVARERLVGEVVPIDAEFRQVAEVAQPAAPPQQAVTTRPETLAGAQPGNPGQPPFPPPRPSGVDRPDHGGAATGVSPGATAASAASPPASTEGEGPEAAEPGPASGVREAGNPSPTPPSLFGARPAAVLVDDPGGEELVRDVQAALGPTARVSLFDPVPDA